MPFHFTPLDIPEVILIETEAFSDARGFFMELYRRSEFAAHGITDDFVHEGYSRSIRGTLRGLHYQKPPKAQKKLVMAVRGEVFDVAVDIRRGSPTCGRWVAVRLAADDRRFLYIPEGFAHGFCVLTDEADLIYKMSAEFVPELDRGVVWNDQDIAIHWPIANPILSAKDAALPRLREAEFDFTFQVVR